MERLYDHRRTFKGRMMDALAYEALMEAKMFPEAFPPPIRGPVWIMGKRYNLPEDKQAMTQDVQSRIWCTYRRNFRPISGTSFSSDAGWGCTLRCGQMLLAQTLICKHLGREWVWIPGKDDSAYMKILEKFLDMRGSEYSLQMIALQGADFGRPVGQWFGPNNVAQAIKKLSLHDNWSKLAVHVAMDMVVVTEDIKCLCQQPHEITVPVDITTKSGKTITLDGSEDHGCTTPPPLRSSNKKLLRYYSVDDQRHQCRESKTSYQRSSSTDKGMEMTNLASPDPYRFHESLDAVTISVTEPRGDGPAATADTPRQCEDNEFRSLLLFIPLRLGQEKFNMEYAEALKACLSLPQSVGIIGGKPRHALYFIGFHENSLLFLDPHTTQPTIQVRDRRHIPDTSYHCSQPDRIPISELDPSVALGFFCKDEADFNNMVKRLQEQVLSKMNHMFELCDQRPKYWGPLGSPTMSLREPFQMVDADSDSSDSEGYVMVTLPSSPTSP